MPLRSRKVMIGLAVLLGGAVLMALEVAGFRIIGRSFGSALRETTTVISVFLLAMSVGYAAGGRIGDRSPRPETRVSPICRFMPFLRQRCCSRYRRCSWR